jgi:hypothetical protein
MPSDYLAKYVLLAFYAQNQEAGSKQDRDEFSEDIFARFDHHIVEAAEKAGLELSEESRSIMAVLASIAPGAAPKTRAGNAVKAYREYRGL